MAWSIAYFLPEKHIPEVRCGDDNGVVEEGEEGDHAYAQQPEPQRDVDFLGKKLL